MTLVRDILPRVQRNLNQLGGVNVQTYSQDAIIEKMQTAFNLLFTKHFWDEYTHWQEVTLDGTLGVSTVSCDQWDYPLRYFRDIRAVVSEWSDVPLSTCPQSIIPQRATGNRPRFIQPYDVDAAKVFKVVPYTSTGDVWVHYRTRPSVFDLDTDVLLDEELIKLAATYQYLADDGTNPDATNSAHALMIAREQAVIAATSNQPVRLTNQRHHYDWYDG